MNNEDNIIGHLNLPKFDGMIVAESITLIGEPTLRPDLGNTAMSCIANVNGSICVIQLNIKLVNEGEVQSNEQ